jgi:hypothetical protein
MLQQYPTKFSWSGLIQLSYRDYMYAIPSGVRNNIENHTSFIEQTYGISVGGFIYHPRLAVFNAGIRYTDYRQLASIGGGKTNSHIYGYNFMLTFLPYRPINFDVFAGRTDYTVNPIGDFINPEWEHTHNAAYSHYGATLRLAKRHLPLMRFEYHHEENESFDLKDNTGTLKSDRFTLDIRGVRQFWKTSYQLLIEYDDFSSANISYRAREMSLNVHSLIKNGLYLTNYFSYYDTDVSKMLSFNSQLTVDRYKHVFDQFYSYRFLRSENRFGGSETQGINGQVMKQTLNSLSGSWTYRFLSGFISSISLNYGLRDENGEGANFYGINFGLSYRRSLLGINFSPRYRFLIKKDDLQGEFLEPDILLDLITKKLRFGTAYASYSLTISKDIFKNKQSAAGAEFGSADLETKTTKTDSVIQNLRIGVRGTVPGQLFSRALWNVEAAIFNSDTTVERPIQAFFFSDVDTFFESPTEKFNKKIQRYSILGNISYPIGWASIFFNAGSSIGKSDGVQQKRAYIENRIQYPIFRNLLIFLKLKELWENFAETSTRRSDEYNLSAQYRIGRTTLSVNGTILRSMNGDIEIYVRRFFLGLRRDF